MMVTSQLLEHDTSLQFGDLIVIILYSLCPCRAQPLFERCVFPGPHSPEPSGRVRSGFAEANLCVGVQAEKLLCVEKKDTRNGE